MKKIILALLLVTFLALPCFADDSNITKAEVREDVASYVLDTVRFLIITQTCEVTYRKVDSNGDTVGEDVKVLFMNVADDPETPEDETNNEFTQLVNLINNESNIKNSITKAVKIKLGL